MSLPTFKVVLVGDGGVGKTTWITKHLTGEFTQKYVPTFGVEIHPFKFFTASGQEVCFDIWDTAGQHKLAGLRDGYYVGADAIILMFDCQSRLSFLNIASWMKDIYRVCKKDIPIVVCGNKHDLRNSKITGDIFKQFIGEKHQKYFISSLSNYDYEKPLTYLAETLLSKSNQRRHNNKK